VDEAVAIRDSTWFAGSPTSPVPLHRYLRDLADSFLEVRGDIAVPRLPPTERRSQRTASLYGALARERWRWLALALPPDLLLASLGNPGNGPDRVELLSPALERHLRDHPYAETHLHLGAALEFPVLWEAALCALAYEDLLTADALASPGAGLEEGQDLCPWLIRAAVMRYLLAHFLFRGRWDDGFPTHLARMAQAGLIPPLGGTGFARLQTGCAELRNGTLYVDPGLDPVAVHAIWKGLYADITRIRGPLQRLASRAAAVHVNSIEVLLGPRGQGHWTAEMEPVARARAYIRLTAAARVDPIEALLGPRGEGHWTAEMELVARARAYLEYGATVNPPRDYTFFAQLFWQVMRVRVLFYRHVVQRPMTPGLQWFIRFYSRLSPARRLLTRVAQFHSAALVGGEERGLRSLEVRLAPEDSVTELRNLIKVAEQVADAWMPLTPRLDQTPAAPGQRRHAWNPTLELGIVFHFIKLRGGGTDKGVPAAGWRDSNANPDLQANRPNARNPTGYRYAQYHREKLDEARRLAWLFRNYPLSLEIVRGLDICTDEIGVPNWVLIPALQCVREAAATASAAVWRTYGRSLPTLRTTIHAGEDFVHLLSGLRQVDEAVEGFELRSGDRIGHGIALGVDARDWARRAGRLPMICEERLWDLVWEWSWYGQGGHSREPGRHSFLDREIAALSERVFGRPFSPYELELVNRDLHRPGALRAIGFPNGLSPDSVVFDKRQKRLYDYLSDALLFRRGREYVWVDTASEGEVLASLQAELRQKVGALGLTVEVNPTSNLLIGNLGDLTVHPLWRLRPPREVDGAPPVSVCIGSDDPVVFGSNLRQEYQILLDAMTLAGLSDEEARQWLDRTRASGMETRFTLSERTGLPIV
jgi:hypothetical protein